MPRKPASGIPARNYSWEPFTEGNFKGLRHGARSERKITPIAEEMIEEILRQRPDLADARFGPTLRAWGFAEAACALYRDYADKVGVVDERTQQPLGYVSAWRTAESQAEQRRRELGIGPYAEAKLITVRAEATTAVGDMSDFIAHGREVLDRRRLRQLEAIRPEEA